jgi:class 3 adenylate cyclase
MKKQKRKQDILIYKMLPPAVIRKMNDGQATEETFESATIFFSCVVDFHRVIKGCKPEEIVYFVNNLYATMEERMDTHDVYKVETISDSFMVASGLPKKNGDK